VTHRWLRPTRPGQQPRIEFGADYNPEQWPRSVWDEDIRAMQRAGVTVVSVAIFSWARLEPSEGKYDFGWLDEVMDLLHAGGIDVDLATATASPPPWLTAKHPEILPVDRDGRTIWPGGRQHWRPTSPIFREHALRITRELATRYGQHPALTAWHVNNELGCHNVYDYSDDAAAAFREWLQERYGDLDALNFAWGTSFWSQHYSDWKQIIPPRLAGTHPNPGQQLDFKRFSSDMLRKHLQAERALLRELTPEIPVTTNFMVMGESKAMDYAAWAADVDFVSNDHYRLPGRQSFDDLSFSANLTGNIAGRKPWFLMEHSTSAVNWQPVNKAKLPGELARDALTHVAHGADAVCYFQWRQSKAGAEKYHSAMVPHAGEDSRIYRDVVELGETLKRLAPVAGSERTQAPAAIVFDWDSWWAVEQDSHPNENLRYKQEALDWYTAFLDLGVRVDVVPAHADLDGYRLVVAPVLHVVPVELREKLEAYANAGGHLVATYFSGIVDENDHAWLGGYPGALRELLGLRIEEFGPLLDGETAELDNGLTGTLWTDHIDVTSDDVEVLASYTRGGAAITRRPVGAGSAAYVSTRLGPDGLKPVLGDLAARAGVESELPENLRGKVELVVRGDYSFVVNRTSERVDLSGLDGEAVHGTAGELAATSVGVLRRPA
jgi:beta-galactosidase